MKPREITADDVRELMTSTTLEPVLVRWDDGELEVCSLVTYAESDREGAILATWSSISFCSARQVARAWARDPDELLRREETHGDSEHGRVYAAAIALIRLVRQQV